ncbi:polysaccharide biosynthesis/export family protein [Ramlibacter sp.]|uniref:polysaccharide biosynthesis/export family protein n=1 Tax=Ramlibacter sp. TaxID=1917967 RepID=UPI002C4EE4FB|nr:polysaccharide biosynthesis/export family protein [Ramlibacter sp.]HWI83890.1 polysaccharide biosynthesis/export family protein [Ramlibacter sp.]
MHTSATGAVRRLLCPLLAAVVVHGCAVVTAPGFDYADPKQRTSVTLGQYVPADVNNPPQGVITPITPALVQAQVQAAPSGIPPEVQALFAEAKPYTIGPSDVIGIVVYDHPELLPNAGAVISQQADPTGISAAPGFIVGADGQVSFPYVGRIKVEGLTEIEAAELLSRRLARVIKEPQVTVRIQSFRSRRAYVEGEVRQPGTQIFTDVPMTLPEAINRAGGVTPNGDRSFVTITRNNQTSRINLMQLQELGVNPNRILLQNGDLVTVRNRDENKVYVMGEIAKPSALVMHNGRLSLNQALGEAGGPNLATANPGQIYVIRNTAQGSPAVYHLNASTPSALALADTFALRPRDVVYIDPVPLVNWNRIISLVLPSAQALSLGRNAVSP